MSLFDFMTKRETTPESALRAQITTINARTEFISPFVRRAPLQELLQVYGMWAHRAVQIKAGVCSAIPFRLFTVGNKEVMRKWQAVGPKALDHQTKQFLAGRKECRHTGYVRKALQGNLEDLTEITKHPVLDLLNDPNGWDEGYSYCEKFYTDLEIYGRHFSHKVYTGNFVTQLWRLDPIIMKVIPSVTKFVDHYEYGNGGDKVDYDTDDILWMKLNDPANPYGGYSWVAAWLSTIKASNAIAEFQLWLMTQGGQPDYLIRSKAGMDEPQKRAFKRAWRTFFGNMFGRRRENIAILTGDLEVDRLGLTNKELEFVQSEQNKRDQIAAASGVPPAFFMSDKIAANSREAMNQFKLLTIWPIVQQVQDRLNQRLVKPIWGDNLILIADNPIEEDRELRILERESKLRSGYSVDSQLIEDGAEPYNTPDSQAPLIMPGLQQLEGMQESAELGREGQRVAMQEPTVVEVGSSHLEEEKPKKGLDIKDVLYLIKETSKPIAPTESVHQLPPEVQASAILGLTMLDQKQHETIIQVTPPEVIVNVPKPDPPIVNVKVDTVAPIVNVPKSEPVINVNVPKSVPAEVTIQNAPPGARQIDINRDGNGRVTGATVRD